MDKKELLGKFLEKNKIVEENHITLILNSYNDLFSSFDPRPYIHRSLSDDFLIECKHASTDKNPGFELRLLIPHSQRDLSDESKIKKRLKAHFFKHYLEKSQEQKSIKKEGVTWFILGSILALAATLFIGKNDFLSHLLLVLLEPAGWFTLWSGLDKIFITSKEKLPDYLFYKRMHHARIVFFSIDD